MASDLIKHVTDATFEADVLKSAQPVLIDYWAEWCGPCKMIAPILDEVSTTYQGKLQVAKMNVDENRDIPAQLSESLEARLVGFCHALSLSPAAAFRTAESLWQPGTTVRVQAEGSRELYTVRVAVAPPPLPGASRGAAIRPLEIVSFALRISPPADLQVADIAATGDFHAFAITYIRENPTLPMVAVLGR